MGQNERTDQLYIPVIVLIILIILRNQRKEGKPYRNKSKSDVTSNPSFKTQVLLLNEDTGL